MAQLTFIFVIQKENKEQKKRIARLEEELEDEKKKRSGEVSSPTHLPLIVNTLKQLNVASLNR